MSKIKTNDRLTLADLTQPGQPSTALDYLAWKDRKVQNALDSARANPDKLLSHDNVRKQLGL